MRLYNILYVCKTSLSGIKAASIVDAPSAQGICIIKNWGICKKSLDALKKIECFRDEIERLYSIIDWFQLEKETARVSCERKSDIREKLAKIIFSVETMVKLSDMMKLGKTESGIDVKIPKCNSLKEYMGYLKEIDFIFTQCPYLLHDKEEIKFNNVDVGSQWLVFAVTGVTASFYILNNLAKLIQKAISISSNILVYRQQEEVLKEMQMKNEVTEETVDVFKKFKQTLLDESVSELENDMGQLRDCEERDKIKKTLENMVVLMDKGVELYSSIETPKEIKVLFPMDKDTAILPDNITKLLEDKENENQVE